MNRVLLHILTGCLLALAASTLYAEEAWTPSSPLPDEVPDVDWIQINNSEWLSGTFISLRNNELKFDSSEFDEQLLDWDDVTELHTSGPVEIVLYDRTVITDRISVIGNKVVLHGQGKLLDRVKILSILPYKESWWSMWDGNISLNMNMRSGNTNNSDFLLQFDSVNRSAFTRVNFNYRGNLSRTNAVLTSNNHWLLLGMDVYLSRRVYLTPLTYDFINNEFKNIKQQHTPATGAGYQIFDTEKFKWDISGSVGYQFIQYYSVQPGQPLIVQGLVTQAGSKLIAEITKTTDYDLSYTFQIDLLDPKNMSHYLLTGLSVEITKSLDIKLTFSWNRFQNPEPRSDGSIPEKDDFTLSAGIGYEF